MILKRKRGKFKTDCISEMNKLNAWWREKKNQIVKCYLLIKPEMKTVHILFGLPTYSVPKGKNAKKFPG